MSSQLTPRRLQKRVDEWREARMKKWADRLQMHADKSRTVSALVLGIKETKSVQLPTPPSTKSNESRSRLSCVNNKMTKAYSSGDVHNYHQQRYSNYLHDYRNGGMCREGPRSPYGHHPRSPHPSGFRGSILPNSEPRKSFAPSGAYRNYTHTTGTENHQQPSTSTYHNKGIRKDANRLQQDKSIRKSLATKEKTVTFEDEIGNVEPSTSRRLEQADASIEVPAAAAGGSVELNLSGGEDSPLNSTFTLDDGNSLNPTTNSVDAVGNNLPAAGYTQEADIPSTSQECTVLEKSNVQEVTISTDLRIIPDNTEVQGDSGHVTKKCAPIIILTEPEYQEKEQGNKNVEAQYETQIKVTGDKDDLVDNEAEVAQLDEELCKEVEAITSELSESDASSFSLCLEANSSPLAEVIEPCQVEPVKDYHEAVGSEDCANDSVFYLAEGAEEVIQPEPASDPLAMEEQGPSTLEPKNVGLKESPMQDKSSHKENTIDVITENLDVLYITPARKGRKSRALLDTTNIVESSSIKYVVREVKQKEMLDADIVITPVRRSTRKKVETPGTLQSGQFVEVLSPQVLRKAKIVPNNFLPT